MLTRSRVFALVFLLASALRCSSGSTLEGWTFSGTTAPEGEDDDDAGICAADAGAVAADSCPP